MGSIAMNRDEMELVNNQCSVHAAPMAVVLADLGNFNQLCQLANGEYKSLFY